MLDVKTAAPSGKEGDGRSRNTGAYVVLACPTLTWVILTGACYHFGIIARLNALLICGLYVRDLN